MGDAPVEKGTGGKRAKRRQNDVGVTSEEGSGMTPDELKALEFYEKMAKEIQERKLEKRSQLR